jgi:predicted esterase
MMPFEPEPLPDLSGRAVFIGAGRADSISPVAQAERLADVLRHSGADVTLHWHPGGHVVTPGEMDAARRWIEQRAAVPGARAAREAGAR